MSRTRRLSTFALFRTVAVAGVLAAAACAPAGTRVATLGDIPPTGGSTGAGATDLGGRALNSNSAPDGFGHLVYRDTGTVVSGESLGGY